MTSSSSAESDLEKTETHTPVNESDPAKTETHTPVNQPDEKPVVPAEGGRAGWLCAVGSTIGLFCTFGFLAA